jgi:anhydro-N-acetylmuramic acid kinase
MKVAGVISGTSADGIDVAVLEFEHTYHVLGHHTVPYPPDVREAILAVSNNHAHIGTIARLNYLLGELFADAVEQTCRKIGIPLAALNLIGSHGQTIFHEGSPVDYHGYRIASTMQIGEPAVIAKRTGVITIADFRADDIAAGGTGAPLVPLLDYLTFKHRERCRAALNIGGIANMTVIPADASIEDVTAFDTGPGNMVIDALMGDAKFDRDGMTARTGRVDRPLLDRLLADPYFSLAPPKSAGREQFGGSFAAHFRDLAVPDAAATATELTTQSIADALSHYSKVDEVIVSGGGVHNTYLMERLRVVLPMEVKTSAEYGVDPDAKEAIAFAVLAYESFHGRPGNLPRATGARAAVILGKGSVPSTSP